LSATYEAIKFQKLDVFSVALKRIGEVISNDQFATAIDTLGDSSGVKNIKYDADSLGYSDLVDLWASCNPFNMNVVIANSKTTANILKMPEFRDANAGLDFHGTGKIITPFGAELIVSNIIDDGLIIGLDKNNALEKVQATGIVTEFDKLIDRQIERASISTIVGFSPIYSESVAVLQTK
jgi:hypothetical protein